MSKVQCPNCKQYKTLKVPFSKQYICGNCRYEFTTEIKNDKESIKKRNKKTIIVFLFATLVIIIMIVVASSGGGSKNTQTPTTQSNEQTQATSQSAQKELSAIIDLAKQAGLVVSYEFSNSASVVYIGSTWYAQTVAFKKDFIAKIGILKNQITGYTHFEVRDAYSNEKVGEITAFSQSIEVYK